MIFITVKLQNGQTLRINTAAIVSYGDQMLIPSTGYQINCQESLEQIDKKLREAGAIAPKPH